MKTTTRLLKSYVKGVLACNSFQIIRFMHQYDMQNIITLVSRNFFLIFYKSMEIISTESMFLYQFFPVLIMKKKCLYKRIEFFHRYMYFYKFN